MFKLLIEEDKKDLQREYSLRRVVVALVALTIVSTIGVVSIFPSYVLSNLRRSESMERQRVSRALGSEDEDISKWVSQINNKLRMLSYARDEDKPSRVIENLLAERGEGIRITSISWKKSDQEISLSISGKARDRQGLIKFEGDVRSSGHFTRVVLPVSNLAKDRDIDFSIRLTPVANL
jgi:type II secretory pathway component PulL